MVKKNRSILDGNFYNGDELETITVDDSYFLLEDFLTERTHINCRIQQ